MSDSLSIPGSRWLDCHPFQPLSKSGHWLMLSDSFLALFKPTLRDDLNTLGNGLDSLVRIIDLLKVAKLALEHESICEACEIFLGPIESAIPELELAENLIDSVYKRLEAELRQATSP